MKRALLALTVLTTLAGVFHAPDSSRSASAPASGMEILTGPPQTVLGPAPHVDSLYATVRDGKRMNAYMSNDRTIWYTQRPDGTLTGGRVVMASGPKGSPDQCGVHPVGGVYKVTESHWITFYHGERANPGQYGGGCSGGAGLRNDTRWSVLRMETFDRGRTWRKREQVLRQDQAFMRWRTGAAARRDDAGSPRLVVRGDHLYLFYRATNRDSPDARQMSVARAHTSSLGRGGAWRKLHEGAFSEPGLGGRQSAITGLPATARGVTWNTYLDAYVSVIAADSGTVLFVSEGEDLTRWHKLEKIVDGHGTGSAWGERCVSGQTPDFPTTIGYGATIGWGGSSTTTGQNFWVYYMKKPRGKCFSHRYLVRRQVSLDGQLHAYPRVTVSSGEPTASTTRFSPPRRVATRHHWVVSAHLSRDGRSWGGRVVRVQRARPSGWTTVRTLRTGPGGQVRLYRSGPGVFRFQVPATATHPAAHTRGFRRPRH